MHVNSKNKETIANQVNLFSRLTYARNLIIAVFVISYCFV